MRKGWVKKTIGETCTLRSGTTVAPNLERPIGDIPYLKVADMTLDGNEVQITSSSRFLIETDVKLSAIIPKGATIFPKRGGAILTNKKRITSVPICADLNIMAVIPSSLIDASLLYYYFLNIDLGRLGSGSSIPQINNYDIAPLLISFPESLSEQQRIVGILDEAFDAIATAKANAEKNLQNARGLFESHLHSVFAQRGESWIEKPLVELCDPNRIITYGVIKLGDEVPDGIPCLRTSNVRWLRIETEGMKRIAPALSSEYSRTILKGGELLVNVRGTLGGVAVAAKEMAGWNVSREVAVVPVDLSLAQSSFLSYSIGSGASQQWLGSVKKGAAYVGINIEDLRRLPVSVPPPEQQLEVIRHLDSLWDETQRLESIYQRKLVALDELKKSLLSKAFSGGL